MNSVGLMTRTGNSSVKVTLTNGFIQEYNLGFGNFDSLDYGWNYPVYFIGFSSSHFIVVYHSRIYNQPTYISTGDFNGEFMVDFIERLAR
jgi:hypothetical protein